MVEIAGRTKGMKLGWLANINLHLVVEDGGLEICKVLYQDMAAQQASWII